jgi:hypothetical protein
MQLEKNMLFDTLYLVPDAFLADAFWKTESDGLPGILYRLDRQPGKCRP